GFVSDCLCAATGARGGAAARPAGRCRRERWRRRACVVAARVSVLVSHGRAFLSVTSSSPAAGASCRRMGGGARKGRGDAPGGSGAGARAGVTRGGGARCRAG